jgi:hypothetical protein
MIVFLHKISLSIHSNGDIFTSTLTVIKISIRHLTQFSFDEFISTNVLLKNTTLAIKIVYLFIDYSLWLSWLPSYAHLHIYLHFKSFLHLNSFYLSAYSYHII